MTNRATVVVCPSSMTSAWPKSTWASPGRWVRGMKTSAWERLQAATASLTMVNLPDSRARHGAARRSAWRCDVASWEPCRRP